jgi:uncharacterized protein (DUF952 family)/nucleoside 2-deoxyribosyltransferase
MAVPLIYVASPLGFTEPGRQYLEGILHPALRASGFVEIDPWIDPGGIVAATTAIPIDDPSYLESLREMNRTLGATNATSIDRSDAVLAVLDGSDVDSGTAAEIGYAAGIGVPVVGFRTDVRSSGENPAATVNLQVEYFIESTGGTICFDIAKVIEALRSATEDRFVYHLAFRSNWAKAISEGTYTASTRDASLEEIGFIHASFARQLGATARRHYADLDPEDLLLLTIDRRRLSARLLVEFAPGVGDAFPHIYGPLNADAVVSAAPVTRDAEGELTPLAR